MARDYLASSKKSSDFRGVSYDLLKKEYKDRLIKVKEQEEEEVEKEMRLSKDNFSSKEKNN